MSTRIFIGIVLFLVLFVTVGYVLINEGLLATQANTESGRMQEFTTGLVKARSVENGATLFSVYCVECHGVRAQGVPGKGPQLYPALFTEHWPALKAQNYPNSLENFVKLTIAAGRPIFSTYYLNQGQTFAATMPTWEIQFGGSLRPDQIEYLTAYILSWESTAGPQAASVFTNAIGSDVEVPLPPGDPERGAALWGLTRNLESAVPAPCSSCHSLTADEVKIGPSLKGIGTTAASRVPGQDAEMYIRTSIQRPNEYIVEQEGYTFTNEQGKSIMPEGLGNSMSPQDLADIIAFLMTQTN